MICWSLITLTNALQNGGTALHMAAEKDCSDVAELLVRSGADVNAKANVRAAFILIVIIALYYVPAISTIGIRS